MVSQGILSPQTQIEALTRINIADMLDNFGLSRVRHGRGVIEWLCWLPARLLARQAAEFDRRVGEVGLQTAACEWLRPMIGRLNVVGAGNVPASGGVIFAVNHPGLIDSLVCFCGVDRADLRIVSNDRPFIRALENVARRTFFVSEQANERLAVVRQVARFLQKGGAVYICPAGQIEPDPAVMPGAIESLANWSDSLGLFVRLAPQAVVVPTVVSGVIYPSSLHHPLTRLRRTQKDRERIAATIQAFWQSRGRIARYMNPRLEFGEPLSSADLIKLGDAAKITLGITTAVRSIIERVVQLENPITDQQTYL